VYADFDRCNPRKVWTIFSFFLLLYHFVTLRQVHKIISFDISPDGTQFSTGFRDGSIYVYPVSPDVDRSIAAKTICKTHTESVNSLEYFPSSRVLLSASTDGSLMIVPAELPALPETVPDPETEVTHPLITPVMTMRGHTKGINAAAIISGGPNVISGSTDGTVRLWDVNSGQQLLTMNTDKNTQVSCVSHGERGNCVAGKGDENTVKSGGIANKIAFCGLKDGTYEAFDIGTGQSIAQGIPPYADRRLEELVGMSYSPKFNMVAMSSIDGTVTLYDTRSLSAPLLSFYRNGAGVEDVRFIDDVEALRKSRGLGEGGSGGIGLLVGPEDGQAFVLDVGPKEPVVLLELQGLDVDSVRVIKLSGTGDIWSVADDGIVRKY
jgi:proteasomal ATPase-associated factor 1